MQQTVEAITPQLLERLCQQPSSAANYSALTGQPLLLVDLLEHPVSAGQQQRLSAIVPRLSCPVIALANPDQTGPLTAAVDVVLASHREARPLINNIMQQPLTAMTLVQVLRHNENASIGDGLLAESLAYAMLQGSQEFKHYLATRPAPPQPAANPQPAVIVERLDQDQNLGLTLNRPEQHNAYSAAMRDALFEGLQLVADDPGINKAIIRGAGPCFCSGGALEEFGLTENISTAHAIRCSRNVGLLLATLAERIECHLHKACIGSGIELPAFAGHITASANTFFHLPEITMGLIPGAGGTVSILRRIGRQRMAYLGLSAKRINAKTALAWGLIDEIV